MWGQPLFCSQPPKCTTATYASLRYRLYLKGKVCGWSDSMILFLEQFITGKNIKKVYGSSSFVHKAQSWLLTLALSGSLSGSLWLSLALSGSLWLALLLSLAPSCSLLLSQAPYCSPNLRTTSSLGSQGPCSARSGAAALQHFLLLCLWTPVGIEQSHRNHEKGYDMQVLCMIKLYSKTSNAEWVFTKYRYTLFGRIWPSKKL